MLISIIVPPAQYMIASEVVQVEKRGEETKQIDNISHEIYNDEFLLYIFKDDSLNRQEKMEKAKEVFDNTPRSMWFRLLNQKDEEDQGVLYYFERLILDLDYAQRSILGYIKDCIGQTPEGKIYLEFKEAIKEKDYDSCNAILKALSVDVDQLYTVLSFTDEENQTLLVKAMDKLYELTKIFQRKCYENSITWKGESNRTTRARNAKEIRIQYEEAKSAALKNCQIVDLFLKYISKLPGDAPYKIVRILDRTDLNALVYATEIGERDWVEKILKMIPEGKLLDMSISYPHLGGNDGQEVEKGAFSSAQLSILESAVKSGNRRITKVWNNQLQRLLKEAKTIRHLTDIKWSMTGALNLGRELGFVVKSYLCTYSDTIEQIEKEIQILRLEENKLNAKKK